MESGPQGRSTLCALERIKVATGDTLFRSLKSEMSACKNNAVTV